MTLFGKNLSKTGLLEFLTLVHLLNSNYSLTKIKVLVMNPLVLEMLTSPSKTTVPLSTPKLMEPEKN